MISPRRNTVGRTGSMQIVNSREVRNSETEYLDKDNAKNRGERKRLTEKFYKKYWGNLETICGHCGTVYRLPRIKNDPDHTPYSIEDIDSFFVYTRINKCPCCKESIHELMPKDAEIYFGRREMIVGEIEVLKLNAATALPAPKPKIDCEE